MLSTINGAVIGSRGSPTEEYVLPITLQLQPQGSEWCWAACCAMILSSPQHPTSVGAAAAKVLGAGVSMRATCDPAVALRECGLAFQVEPKGLGGPMDSRSLVQWIVYTGKPVAVYWAYGPSNGHMALIAGHRPAGLPWRVLDPLQGEGWYDDKYLGTYGGRGQWYDTYYDIG